MQDMSLIIPVCTQIQCEQQVQTEPIRIEIGMDTLGNYWYYITVCLRFLFLTLIWRFANNLFDCLSACVFSCRLISI